MKKSYQGLLLMLLIVTKVNGQDFISDSLRNEIANPKSDSLKAAALMELARHQFIDLRKTDTVPVIINSTLAFTRQKGLLNQEAICTGLQGNYYFFVTGKDRDLNKGYLLNLKAISLARQHDFKATEIDLLIALSFKLTNNQFGNKSDSVKLLMEQAFNMAVQNKLVEQQINALSIKGNYYSRIKTDSAKKYYLQALALSRQSLLPKAEISLLRTMANAYSTNHWGDSSNLLMQEAVRVARANHLIDQEISVLRSFIASESGFFVKDSFFTNYERLLLLSRQYKKDSLGFMPTFAQSCTDMGNYPRALQVFFILLHANEEKRDSSQIESILFQIGHTYCDTKDYKKAIEYFYKAKVYGTKNAFTYIFIHGDLAKAYLRLHQNDSASYYAGKAYEIAVDFYGGSSKVYGGVLNDLGMVYDELGQDSLALDYLRRSYVYFTTVSVQYLNYCGTTIGLANYFKKKGMVDSSFFYARLCLTTSLDKGFLPYISESSSIITAYFYNKHNTDSAYYYQNIGFEAYKTLYNDESGRQIQNMALAEQQREDDIAQAKKTANDEYAGKLRLRGMITIGIAALIIGIIVYRNNRRRQKSYELLKKQKQEIDLQKSKLETSLSELQTTQSQLIQSEKMASLGELTAGIAHEIQNPLNFVNNFAEVNSELIGEMKDELSKGNIEEAKTISTDIDENEKKIIFHGKRADAIVKGMLQHSRSSSGVKEPTDINALADEYLRLAYHGLRAKDKSFNATMKTDFDETIGNINIIPQDIGRVILNLITNAFYVVDEKKKSGLANLPTGQAGYEPNVTVSTKRINGKVEIKVADNGNGIPQKVLDKIFQPFFTTKPTGQGTGLGLSLSYDIVKAHGGELEVETKENEGTTFIIQLPTN